MVEPIFDCEHVSVTNGEPSAFDTRSEGSGKIVHVHFCSACGTKLFLTFERFATSCGIYAGTFDDPQWFEVVPENSKHIFVEVARHDTILPPDVPLFEKHAIENDGAPIEPRFVERPTPVRHEGQ